MAFDSYRSKNPDSKVKTDYLRRPQNKVHNKGNPLELPPNHPPPGPWENCLPQNRPVVPEKLGTPDPESSLQVSDAVPKPRQKVLQSTVCKKVQKQQGFWLLRVRQNFPPRQLQRSLISSDSHFPCFLCEHVTLTSISA